MAKSKSKRGDEAYAKAERRIEKARREDENSLDLSGLGLTELPESIGQLTQLQSLDLSANRLTAVPDALGQLTQLQTLDLSGNELTGVRDALGQLTQLRVLLLGDNELTAVPDALGQLSQLQTLDLSFNQLTTVPDALGQLTRLWWLDLSDNRLSSLPQALRKLTALEELYLHGNDALGIPTEVLGPTWEDVGGKNLKPARPADILDYYFRIHVEKARRPLNEAKLILLGRGEVGKTCLVNRLVYDKFVSTSMTRGISITQWPVKVGKGAVRVHVWDFGGQEIQHATHQFFLTERSLYLVALNGRAGAEEDDAEYWLKFVKTFGAESPTIVVLNKFRENPFEVNRRALQEKYPFIRAFVETDCRPKTRNGIPQLKREIASALAAMRDVREPFPGEWFRIKDELAKMKKPFISFAQYRQTCSRLGESNTEAQERLAVFLNALGIALNYRTDPRLRDETVLNPRWITQGVYRILTSKKLSERAGELRLKDLSDILPKKAYPPRMHAFLIELMRKFDLCFPYHDDPQEDRYLVPERLGKEQPALKGLVPPTESLNFRYEYPMMPEGILPRFITRTHAMSSPAERWHTGVVLRWEGCRALVKADKHDRQVLARVQGPAGKQQRLLAVIRENFDHIHREMGDFQPTAWVALKGQVDEWLKHADLEVYEQSQVKEVPATVDGKVVPVRVSEMLDATDVPRARRRRRVREARVEPLKLFISYAREDEKWRARLSPNLDLLEREDLLRVWHDAKIVPGSKWDDEIRRQLDEADLYIFLMSTHLLRSDYVQKMELPIARKRHEADQARLVPVITSRCSWKRYVGDIQALPSRGRPMSNWRPHDDACFDVEEGLRRTIDEIRRVQGRHALHAEAEP